ANTVLDGAQGRTRETRLTLVSQREGGPPPLVESFPDDPAEADGIADRIADLVSQGRPASEIAILFRTNSQSEAFEQALTFRGTMVSLRAATRVDQLYPARAVRDSLSQQGWSPTAAETTGAVRDRWDSLNALVGLTDTVTTRPGTTMVDVVRELEERAEAQAAPVVDGVTLASVHAAKGLEWPVVFVVGASDGLLPISMAKTPAEVEEERRLFYVALTRARDLLTVSWAAARTPGARGSRKPSRFLDGVLDHPDAPRPSPGAG